MYPICIYECPSGEGTRKDHGRPRPAMDALIVQSFQAVLRQKTGTQWPMMWSLLLARDNYVRMIFAISAVITVDTSSGARLNFWLN